MPFSPELAAIRFGCGLSPTVAPPKEPAAILSALAGPDRMARQYPMGSTAILLDRLTTRAKLYARAKNAGVGTETRKAVKALRRESVRDGVQWYGRSLLRWIDTRDGLRERLAAFWADHFTARGKVPILRFAAAPYADEAIRPNLTGSFADMLIAVITHPLMLHFLDQGTSVGPGSRAAAQAKRLQGLNENLAREVMELHTLGVDGPYTQDDVRQLAELFTGLSFSRDKGFRFRPGFAEPGAETVMGRSYGGDPAALEPVLQALRDLAVHPATARHIARKLAVHFVSDRPDPALVRHVERRFAETGGDLMAVYSALLEHPASWGETLENVKPPADFIASACRALVPDKSRLAKLPGGLAKGVFLRPLNIMGQPWLTPNGPDGWPEEDAAWITPQGVSMRLRWALEVPRRLRRALPDPRGFVTTALGNFASPSVHFAASAAESRSDAIGLVLAAPAFQRR